MFSPGKVIEYLDSGKFICALVMESQPKKLRLLNQNGREIVLPVSRVIYCSNSSCSETASKEFISQTLQDITAKRSQLMAEINLEELWELTKDEPTSLFSPAFLAELAFGAETSDDHICAFLRCVFLDKLFFKYKEGKVQVNSAEQVEKLRQQSDAEAKQARLIKEGAEVIELLAQKKHQEYKEEHPEFFGEITQMIRDYYIQGADYKNAATARQLLKEAGQHNPHAPYHLLVNSGRWTQHENIPLLRSELPVGFSHAARLQAEAILQTDINELFNDPGRVDYTHLKPITIDGATTQDFDDALSIEREGEDYLVGIHISDVAHYVKPGDALFQEAMQRGTSIYFPEAQIPMLPRHLSQGICSLIQGETRATMSFMILLSPAGEVKRVRIKPSIIRVARRLTYEEADSMLESDEELKMLNLMAKRLRQNRIDNGALLLPFPDVNIFIDSHSKVHVQLAKSDTPARILVAEMMILANSEAARYISDRLIPGLYRSQPELKNRLVHGAEEDLFQNTKQRKHLPRGELSTLVKPHSGLGVNQYTTITSPIRRLLDLVMQHQLNTIIRRQDPKFTEDMCKDFTAVLTRVLSRANTVRQQRHRYWLIRYLEERKGKLMDALVIQTGPKRTNILITDILLDADIPTISGVNPGQMVKVRVAKADALDNVLRFDW